MTERTAIVSASAEELDLSGPLWKGFVHKPVAGYQIYEGSLEGKPLVILITGWGKVRAAQGITLLYCRYRLSQLFFIGACGGIGGWQRGDICIPLLFDYYDFNVYPLLEPYAYPPFEPDVYLPLKAGSRAMKLAGELKAVFNRAYYGLALTGDSFVSDAEIIHRTGKVIKHRSATVPIKIKKGKRPSAEYLKLLQLMNNSPEGAIIDMESTAVAETCINLKLDFLVIRIVSDCIDANSHTDFTAFLSDTMPGMVKTLINIIGKH